MNYVCYEGLKSRLGGALIVGRGWWQKDGQLNGDSPATANKMGTDVQHTCVVDQGSLGDQGVPCRVSPVIDVIG